MGVHVETTKWKTEQWEQDQLVSNIYWRNLNGKWTLMATMTYQNFKPGFSEATQLSNESFEDKIPKWDLTFVYLNKN